MVNLYRVISVQVLLLVKYMFAQKNTSLTNCNSSTNNCNVTNTSFLSNRIDQQLFSPNSFNPDQSHLGVNLKSSHNEFINNQFIKPNSYKDSSTLKDQNLYPSVIKSSGILLNNLDKNINNDYVCNDGEKNEIISEINENKLNKKVGRDRNYNNNLYTSIQDLDKHNLISNDFFFDTQNIFNVCNYCIASELTTDNVISNTNNNAEYSNAKDSQMESIKNNNLKRIDCQHDKMHYVRNNNLANLRLRDNDKVRYNLFYDVSRSNIKKSNGDENTNLIDSRHKVKRDYKLYTKGNLVNNTSKSFKDLSLNNDLRKGKDAHCLLPDKCKYDDGDTKINIIGTTGFLDGTDIESNTAPTTQNYSAYFLGTYDLINSNEGRSVNNNRDSSGGMDFNDYQNYTTEESIDKINFKGNNNIEYIHDKDSFDVINSSKRCKNILKQKPNNKTKLAHENDLQPEGSVQRTKYGYQSLFDKQSSLYKMAEKMSKGYIDNIIKNASYPWEEDEFRERILDNVLLRIIGGNTVSIDDYPYMVTLHLRGSTICGGTIISEQHILTAGHCIVKEIIDNEVYKRDPANLHIRAGTTYSDYGGVTRRVADVYPHPRYGAGFLYDLGIILLQAPLEPSRKIHVIGLAGPEETNILYKMMKEEHTCWVAGWGDVHPNLLSHPSPRRSRNSINPSHLRIHYSNHLKAVKTKMITWEKCKQVQPWVREDCMICTGHNDISGPCQRDSGSPLICSGLQYGIVSWGEGCGRPEEPDIFSRVDTAYDFVVDIVNPSPFDQMAFPEVSNDSGKTGSFLNALMLLCIIFM